MTHSISAEKLLAVNSIVAKLVPELRRRGVRHAASATSQAHWMLTDYGLVMNLAEGVLLSPIEPTLSSLLDIWPENGSRKVLSVNWYPSRLWHLRRVVVFKPGSWTQKLFIQE
jgi:hypothetical protein